jgi:hypothetical protein
VQQADLAGIELRRIKNARWRRRALYNGFLLSAISCLAQPPFNDTFSIEAGVKLGQSFMRFGAHPMTHENDWDLTDFRDPKKISEICVVGVVFLFSKQSTGSKKQDPQGDV